MPPKRGRVTRFTVMAILQAARAQRLGLPREAAYSWGLNRAIFYAAAKRGFRGSSGGGGGSESHSSGGGPADGREAYRLGDDEAYRDPDADQLLFRIGGEDQTPAEFERQIAARFGKKKNFRTAWEEAIHIVESFDRPTLESRNQFFNEVYKPRRDELAENWSRRFGSPPALP